MINGYINQNDLEELVKEKLISLGIKDEDYPINPYELISNERIILSKQQFDNDHIKGMLVNGPEVSGIILNCNRSEQSMRFAAMHELSHYWFHPKRPNTVCFENYSLSNKGIEWQANHAAGYALMPTQVVIDLFDYTLGSYEYMAKYLNVSIEALKYRCSDIKDLPKVHPVFAYRCEFI